MRVARTIWERICAFWARRRIAAVWRVLFNGEFVTPTVTILTDGAIMDAAFGISLALLGEKASGVEKAREFDELMLEWCERKGEAAPSVADMNAVREIAYAAVRCRMESAAI